MAWPMSGLELAHEVQRAWPSLPIVLMSGYESPQKLASQGLGDVPLLRKPFDREDLLALVRSACHSPQHAAS